MALPNLGGKNQPFVDIIFASAPGSGFPNSSPEVGQRKWAKGGWSGKQPSPPEWECVVGEVLQLEELAEVQTQNGEQGARTLPHLCQAAPSPAPARCGRMGNAATERCTRPGNEQQEQHRVGMRGEFTRGQSPSPFIFGRFG